MSAYNVRMNIRFFDLFIRESVDSLCRDGADTPIA